MKYFSGFSLHNEQELFDEYTLKGEYNVAGFSYGAQKAFEYVLNTDNRIDTLQLFSPAYFNDKHNEYKASQLKAFKLNQSYYIKKFIQHVVFPSNISLDKYMSSGTYEELNELLNYTWSIQKLQKIIDKGVLIEVYIGKEDKVVSSSQINDFFAHTCEIYKFNHCGHILQKYIEPSLQL